MNEENKRLNIEAELERSADCLEEARVLIDAGLPLGAVSRLYYAIYHAAVALLLSEGLEPRTHAGVNRLLGLHFVRTGRLDPDDGRLFARIQKYRFEADYAREFVVTNSAAREDLATGEGFLRRVRGLISRAGYTG